MAKNSITDYDNTAANNTDVQSVDIAEGCSPSGINNAIREVMADLADVDDGTVALTSPAIGTSLDMNGNELILDADGDSKIEASTDDTINIISGGTTGLTIGNGGIVTHPSRPIFSARGVATSTSLTAAASYFDTVTSWTQTDVNVGSLLQAGGYAEVPSGFAGIYQITWVHNRTTTTAYHSAILFHYDGSTYTNLMTHYANNDYNNYTVGTTFFYNLAVGDRIYVGWNDAYGIPETDAYASNFSMMFVG